MRNMRTTRFLHSCPNVYTRHRIARINVHTPTWMRAPGEASGIYALESAMDELAVALQMDPVELRLRNEPEQDEFKKLPFSSRSTRECYRVGAERFGWSRRNPEPRSMRDGHWPLGWGMAMATYPMNFAPVLSNGATPARWERRGHERGKRYGAGHVDVNDAGCSRCPWLADRAGELRAWRQPVAEIAAAWRLDDNGKRR